MDLEQKKKKLKKIMSQVSGDIENLEGDLEEPKMIRGSGILYCYEPSTRQFLKLNRGTVVYIITKSSKHEDKFLVYAQEGVVVLLDEREIIDIGFD